MDLSLAHTALLFVTAIWAGALNAIAGGGTFFTFPVLLLVGMPPIIANTTNKFALTFASISGVLGFWHEIKTIRHKLLFFTSIAILGSISGSLLLLITPDNRFEALVPWLMLSATLLFAFGNKLVRYFAKHHSHRHCERSAAIQHNKHQARTHGLPRRRRLLAMTFPAISLSLIFIALGQFAIGVYGGFFAAGMGILMMALYEVAGMKNIHEMNALKSVVGLGINAISAITFLFAGALDWHVAIILIAGALIGGYSGATLSKKLKPSTLRSFIVLYGTAMTLYFFLK